MANSLGLFKRLRSVNILGSGKECCVSLSDPVSVVLQDNCWQESFVAII